MARHSPSDMGAHMKTTIEIADALLVEARGAAAREKTTLRALVEEGLREVLRRRKSRTKPFRLPDLTVRGQTLAPEFAARGGWTKLREAAYPGFFDDERETEP